MYIIVFAWNFLTVNKLSNKCTIKVSCLQNFCLWICCFGKEVLFFSTEDENLWINSRLMQFDGQRTPERFPSTPPKIMSLNKKQEAFRRKLCQNFQILFINISLYFKGMCYRDLHWYGSWFIDTNLRSILLYCVYVFLILIKTLCLSSSFKNVMYNQKIQVNRYHL